MSELNLVNHAEVNRWMNERMQMGHDMQAVKGYPSIHGKECTLDGLVNVAWLDTTTGERIELKYCLSPVLQ